MTIRTLVLGSILCGLLPLAAAELPGRYFRLLEAGSAKVAVRLDADAGWDLKAIEATRLAPLPLRDPSRLLSCSAKSTPIIRGTAIPR
jgi:hypothetical protein